MRVFFTSMLALLAATFHAGAQEKFLLFESYQNDTIPYRIPAMAELWDGSVYALADFRHCAMRMDRMCMWPCSLCLSAREEQMWEYMQRNCLKTSQA